MCFNTQRNNSIMKFSFFGVKNCRSDRTVRTVYSPNSIGILGYNAVTSAQSMVLLTGNVFSDISRMIWREEVHIVFNIFRTGCSSLSKYTDVWYVIVPLEETIGRPGMGGMSVLCILGIV